MFNFSFNTPCEIQGKIQVTKRISWLGLVTDIHGARWHINAIIGNYVQACREEQLHPYYTDTSNTSDYGVVSQRWLPYEIEICDVGAEVSE